MANYDAKLSKRGRMVLPDGSHKTLNLASKAVVVDSKPIIAFKASATGDLVAWEGTHFLGDNWTVEQFIASLNN